MAISSTRIQPMPAGWINWLALTHSSILTPKGRDEDALKMPMSWVRHHDKYGDGYFVDPETTCGDREVGGAPSCCSEQHS